MRKLLLGSWALSLFGLVACSGGGPNPAPPEVSSLPKASPVARQTKTPPPEPKRNPGKESKQQVSKRPIHAGKFFDPQGPDSAIRTGGKPKPPSDIPTAGGPRHGSGEQVAKKAPPSDIPGFPGAGSGEKPGTTQPPTFPGTGKDKPPPAKKDEKRMPAKKGEKGGIQLQPFPPPTGKDFVRKKKDGSQLQLIGGKTIDEWIAEIPSKDRSVAENAIRTVLLFGPKHAERAARAIMIELKKHTSYKPQDVSIRVNGVVALGEIFQEGMKHDPKLLNYAIKYLIRMLSDSQVLVKYRAAQALAKVGPAAVEAIPKLTETLRDRSTWEVRQQSALALGRVAKQKTGPDVRALRALYTALVSDSASQVRLAAIQALAYLGPPARPEDAAIVREKLDQVALNDANPMVRMWAHMAVMNILGKVDEGRMQMIARMLHHNDVAVRIQAAKAIWAVGLEAKEQIPNLIAALEDPEPGVVYWAMYALAQMKRHSEPALPKLRQLVKDKEQPQAIRAMAGQVIQIIEGKQSKVENDKASQ